jgi:glycosyltransferase involved in cell wall biosynthesis
LIEGGAPARTVLAFPFHDWRKSAAEGFRTRDAHLIQALGRRHDVERILVIDRPTSMAERVLRRLPASAAGQRRDTTRFGGAVATLTTVADKIDALDIAVRDVLSPVLRRRGWWFDVFAKQDVCDAVAWGVRTCLGSPTNVIAWVPAVAPVLFAAGGTVVFDSLDNWLVHPVLRRNRSEAEAAYAAIVPRADRVYVSGAASAIVLGRWRKDITVLPNGVDPSVFERETARPDDLPEPPVVGYVGKLAERIDDELVAAVAGAMPDVSFAFVGPVLERRAVREMRRRRNVRLLGDRPYATMPAYTMAFDAAWIPHRVGEGETGGDPIKLYEYWAAGRQVVTTAIDGSTGWTSQARLVRGPTEAVAAIRGILDGSLPPLPTSIPPGRTWDEIAATLLEE